MAILDPNLDPNNPTGSQNASGQSNGENSSINPSLGGNQASGMGGTGTGANGASPSPSSGTQARGSGMSLGNINQYVEANQPEANKITGALTQGATNQANNIGQELSNKYNTLSSQYQGVQGQVNQDTNNYRTSIANSMGFPDWNSYQASLNGGASGSTSQAGPSADQQAAFKNISSGQNSSNYQNQINQFDSGFGSQQSQINQLNQLTNNLPQSADAQKQMLQNQFGKGNNQYNQGEQNLDLAIMQNSPGFQQANNQIRQQISADQNQLNGYNQQLAPVQSALSSSLGSLQGQSRADLDAANAQIKANVQKEAGLYNTDLQNSASSAKAMLNENYISQDLFNRLDPNSQAALQNLIKSGGSFKNPFGGNYLSPFTAQTVDPNNLTETQAEQIANPMEIQASQNLAGLTGASPSFLAGSSPTNGKLTLASLGIDPAALAQAEGVQKQDYNSSLQSLASTQAKGVGDAAYNDFGRQYGAGGNNAFNNTYQTMFGQDALTNALKTGMGFEGLVNGQLDPNNNNYLAGNAITPEQLNAIRQSYLQAQQRISPYLTNSSFQIGNPKPPVPLTPEMKAVEEAELNKVNNPTPVGPARLVLK